MATPENKVKTLIAFSIKRFSAEKFSDVNRVWTYWPVNCGMGRSGVPDVIGNATDFVDNMPFAIEAKAVVASDSKGPTPLQASEMRAMRERGYKVACIGRRPMESDIEIVERVETILYIWWAGGLDGGLTDYEHLLTE